MVKNRVVVGVAIRVNAIDGLERDGAGGRVVSEYWRADDTIVVRPEGQVSVAEVVRGKERLKPRRVRDGRSRDIATRIDVKVLGVVIDRIKVAGRRALRHGHFSLTGVQVEREEARAFG